MAGLMSRLKGVFRTEPPVREVSVEGSSSIQSTGVAPDLDLPPTPAQERASVMARWDSAQTTDENKRHWIHADHLSPNAALIPAVRKLVRSRSRYEHENNTYAAGIVSSLCDYAVGTGARLQMVTDDEGLNKVVEDKFRQWAVAVGLAEKLYTIAKTEIVSGEAFAVLSNNSKLPQAQLDIKLLETDQVADPIFQSIIDINALDGIKCDEDGNPIEYRVLRQHPGDRFRIFGDKFDDIPASRMLHLFQANRPGQKRGMSQLTQALPLFAQMRRYTLAVLSAAESAALPSGVITTDAPADDQVANVDPMDKIDMERNTWLTLPAGWKVDQFKAEHPTSTYGEFKRELLNEIARVLGVPFNIAAGNSAKYNYASGRLDFQAFARAIVVRQKRLVDSILNPLFAAWLHEMRLIRGGLPKKVGSLDLSKSHRWFFDGNEHVDPAREAKGQQLRLGSMTTTLAAEYAKQGKDWQVEIKQRAKELKELKKLGLVGIADGAPPQPAT